MHFTSPGNADNLPPSLLQRWNDTIKRKYAGQGGLHSKFFVLDPQLIQAGDTPVSWPGDPAEPAFCMSEAVARVLSDWGVRGRHALHNEYCEYRVIDGVDAAGNLRPKRVQVTTELREYWECVAVHDPVALRSMCEQVLGAAPTWQDLYGVSDPVALSARRRKVAFARQTAGNGGDPELQDAGVPAQPEGDLNRRNALFMTHPINGLDDLLYIVLFGAQPYARMVGGERRPATKEQIFRAFGVTQLACRHADPAAATAAHQQAYEGRKISFSPDLGVYINEFTESAFEYQDQPLPPAWLRRSRGNQRLEFGPPDTEDVFLDDIVLVEGASRTPLTGGYDVVRHIEVGPKLRIGPPSVLKEADYKMLTEDATAIPCSEAEICQRIKSLKAEYDQAAQAGRVAPRRMGWRE
ncbi:hypothetical protein [Pseudoduganella namucuonensis]|uniref:Uncharacterized protein n=1 Tax=Pseudoduganella namucuonensis TaxID=1035707 RepID=A0A1I7IYI4_9BURK|nr:hypothetical protein [Pseudoduganella namucuonensis]SFU78013.1 hypothetical protein SAMN05216552_1009165 [Pseudoduganella namucuonensis]